ncbi:hypothetical protein GCM10010401_08900 [Rarobacter faecitabidus]|uniref:Homeodomain-like domain-containing protein n=1 Tax=Rarobacter faecitabidus TaxID=13243 RepID=A0A542ZB25_RARFA|nr:hypothetical protein [Rarobacter faecitabidus]TQL57491.1 hypothetical protein FB461_2228 [Rarobacter faecitabidus]
MQQDELFVAPELTAHDARTITDRLRTALDVTWQLIVDAYQGRAWKALGYGSWDDYCTSEFGNRRLPLPREERSEVVNSLRDAGLSQRAIMSATGLSKGTVSRSVALSSAPFGAVDSSTWIDGGEAPDDVLPRFEARAVARSLDAIGRKVVGLDGKVRPDDRATRREVLERRTEAARLHVIKKMSQPQIAASLGVSQATISNDLAAVSRLASEMDLTVEDLVAEAPTPQALAAFASIDTHPGAQLATTARHIMRDLDAGAQQLLHAVILADGWVEPGEKDAAVAVVVPQLADVMLVLARASAEISTTDILDHQLQLRWTRTIADVVDQLAHTK